MEGEILNFNVLEVLEIIIDKILVVIFYLKYQLSYLQGKFLSILQVHIIILIIKW